MTFDGRMVQTIRSFAMVLPPNDFLLNGFTAIGIFLVAPIKGRYRTVPAVMNADCTRVPGNSYDPAAGISFQPAPVSSRIPAGRHVAKVSLFNPPHVRVPIPTDMGSVGCKMYRSTVTTASWRSHPRAAFRWRKVVEPGT